MELPDFAAMRRAVDAGSIRAIDFQFARFMGDQVRPPDDGQCRALIFWTAYLLSKAQGENHICILLTRLAGKACRIFPEGAVVHLPDLSRWRQQLLASGLVGEGGCNDGPAVQGLPLPLILAGDRLYLARYWHYEHQVANRLNRKAAEKVQVEDDQLAGQLNALFSTDDDAGEVNWQKVACAQAAMNRLAVITGGPGTGKTTTVIRLLALILMQAEEPARLIVRMAAPTGKAAARMTESIRNAKAGLNVSESIRELIPEQATTLHRLLGAAPESIAFRHNEQNRLHLDLLVLDEASMVDLSLMAKLLAALPDNCRLVILGDKDQLSSVEAGSVLGDLCASISLADGTALMNYSRNAADRLQALTGYDLGFHVSPSARKIADSVCLLQKSYRFGGGVGQLAQAINRGEASQALAVLMAPDQKDIQLHTQGSMTELVKLAIGGYRDYLQGLALPPAEVIRRFDDFRVLSATRKGSFGTAALNRGIEQAMHLRGLVDADEEFYPGRPIMVTRNDYNTRLFNGDTGIVLPLPEDPSQRRVYFLQPDNSVRGIMPGRLPPHETAFAMTVHKSQGSEFGRVVVALPDSAALADNLNRELLYTGVTRGKAQVSVFASQQVFRQAVGRGTECESGLAERLS